MSRLATGIKVPVLHKVSWTLYNVVLVLPRAPAWAGARLLLRQTGKWETERLRALSKDTAQDREEVGPRRELQACQRSGSLLQRWAWAEVRG